MELSARTNITRRKVSMDYSTLARNLAQDADGVLIDVHSLYARFLKLVDRRGRHGRRYALALILVAIVLAKLAGEDNPSGIADWARARKELFSEVFALKRAAMPSHSTYRRALKRGMSVEDLEREVSAFLSAWPEVGTEVRITLDGKTVRGTIAWGETRGLHLLAAYLPGAGVVLFQVAVDTKTNEITAAPKVLKVLDLQGKIVTGDAMFAQRALSLLIVQAGGDYVWTVKDNQSRLKQDIEQLFAGDQECVSGFSPAPTDFRTASTTNSGHGRIEKRTLTTSSLLNDTCDWPGAQQVFKLERESELVARGQRRAEVAYGITSLSAAEAGPDRLLAIVREHWEQENGLHYRRDVTFQEDAGRTRDWTVAHALAILNNLVLALLLRGGHTNVAQARRYYAAHPDLALKLLLMAPT
jgi:predicted transposase YbfD/YdcC